MGFPQLAKAISEDPDHETYVFRSFSQLGSRTLLQLQSELALLEKQQERLDEEHKKLLSNRHVQLMLTQWKTAPSGQEDEWQDDPEVEKRLHLAKTIAAKLEEYYRLLRLHSQIAALEPPNDRVLNAYRSMFYGDDGETPQLYEPLAARALRSDEHDYVALVAPKDHDLLSRFMRNHLPAPAKSIYSDSHQKVKQYDTRWLVRIARVCSILIAAVLLLASILLLYYFQAPGTRLALVLVFVVLFVLAVSVSTTATRDSIFAATAAYAAVLIVFVSGNLGNTTTGSMTGFLTGNDSNSSISLTGTFS